MAFLICLPTEVSAATGTVKVITSAPAGTKLRIQASPYDFAVTGADKSEFFGEYFSRGAGSEITISADNLSQIEVYGCELTSFEVVSGSDLFIIKCYNNKLETLDLKGCAKLEVLDCHNNKLTALDLSANPILETLNVSENKLETLTLGTQDKLTTLDCSNTKLSQLDLTNCPALNDLSFHNCNISSVNLSNNKMLEWIYAYGNNLAGESMDNFIASMPEARTTGLIYIVDTRDDSENNVCTMDNVRAFAAKGWATMDYFGGYATDTQVGKFYPGSDYVPTVSDRKIALTTSRAAGETISLYIGTSANISISGVKEIAASGRQTYTLTSQNVEIAGDVTALECNGNDLTSLSFSDASLLTRLECQNNNLESLDMSGAKALTQLYSQHNKLETLNLDGCTSLLRVDCYQNQLKGNNMKALMNSLYDATDTPYLFVIDTEAKDGSEGNVATKDDVKIATDKGWKVFDYANGANWGMGVVYAGSDPEEPQLPAEYFTITRPDKGHIMITVNFADKNYYPVIEGGNLAGWNGSALTVDMTEETLKVYGDAVLLYPIMTFINGIDVTNLPNLVELNIALNDITDLDLSKNSKLETLSCEGNLLKSLDFSGCPAIDYVNCYGNQIKGSDMTAMVNSLPTRSAEATGQLIVFDGSYAYEGNECLSSDVELAKTKFWVTYELSGDDVIPYKGFESSGIEDIAVSGGSLTYDAATATVTSASPVTIEIYSTNGHIVAKATDALSLSVAGLDRGIYIVRSGSETMKISR